MKKRLTDETMIITRTRTLEFLVTAEVKRDGKKVDIADVPEMDWETDGRFVEDSTVKYALRNNNFTATLCIKNEYPLDAPGVWEDEDGTPTSLMDELIYQARADKHNATLRRRKKGRNSLPERMVAK